MRGETTTIERPPHLYPAWRNEWAFDINRHICSLSQLARKRNLSAARGNRFFAIWLCTTAYHPSAYHLFPRVTTLLGTQPLSLPFLHSNMLSHFRADGCSDVDGRMSVHICHYPRTNVRGHELSLYETYRGMGKLI